MRLEGARRVSLAGYSRPTGVFVVAFTSTPKVDPREVQANLGPYTLKKIGLRVIAPVSKKDGAFRAGDFLLANPPEGEGFKDVLRDVKGFLKEGKNTLLIDGDLSEDEEGTQTLTLNEVKLPE